MKNIISALSLLLIASCGSMLGGKTKSINLLSADPDHNPKVEILVNGTVIEQELPTVFLANRGNDNIIINVKEDECFKSTQTIVTPIYNLWAILDFN